MEIEYGDSRRLSHGVIKYLNNYKVNDNKRTLYVNFILQIYQCVPLLNTNYYSCSLFDDESICKTFIIKYNSNEGRPYEGDIISITKIIINILNEKESRIYCCEETKLLEKSSKFLTNPENLSNITSKSKIKNNNKENLNKNNDNKKMIKENKNLKEEKVNNIILINNINKEKKEEMKKEIKCQKIIENNYNNLENEETDITNNNINKNEKHLKVINEKINENKINKLNETTPFDKIKVNLIKIQPKKIDESLKTKDKEIMESINLFIDDFEDGKNLSIEENHSSIPIDFGVIRKIENNKELNLKENKNNSKDYKNNIIKRIPKNKHNKKDDNIKIIYINELKEILKNYRNKSVDFKVKIKCRIKTFFHSYNNFYVGCSNCHKKIKNNIVCCKNRKEELIYSFYVTVRDASGVVTIFFLNKIGKKFMDMSAQEYKELLDNKEPIGQILLSSFINNFYDYEYLFTLEFLEPRKFGDMKKKYNVIEIEKITKKHKYEMINELKNILKI